MTRAARLLRLRTAVFACLGAVGLLGGGLASAGAIGLNTPMVGALPLLRGYAVPVGPPVVRRRPCLRGPDDGAVPPSVSLRGGLPGPHLGPPPLSPRDDGGQLRSCRAAWRWPTTGCPGPTRPRHQPSRRVSRVPGLGTPVPDGVALRFGLGPGRRHAHLVRTRSTKPPAALGGRGRGQPRRQRRPDAALARPRAQPVGTLRILGLRRPARPRRPRSSPTPGAAAPAVSASLLAAQGLVTVRLPRGLRGPLHIGLPSRASDLSPRHLAEHRGGRGHLPGGLALSERSSRRHDLGRRHDRDRATCRAREPARSSSGGPPRGPDSPSRHGSKEPPRRSGSPRPLRSHPAGLRRPGPGRRRGTIPLSTPATAARRPAYPPQVVAPRRGLCVRKRGARSSRPGHRERGDPGRFRSRCPRCGAPEWRAGRCGCRWSKRSSWPIWASTSRTVSSTRSRGSGSSARSLAASRSSTARRGARARPGSGGHTRDIPAPPTSYRFRRATIAISSAIFFWHSLLLHANVRIGFGPLNQIIASPVFHHWHHAACPEAGGKNFAGQLSILDTIFDTTYMPAGQEPQRYGVDDPLPHTFVSSSSSPFKKPRPTTGIGQKSNDGSAGSSGLIEARTRFTSTTDTASPSPPKGRDPGARSVREEHGPPFADVRSPEGFKGPARGPRTSRDSHPTETNRCSSNRRASRRQ